MGQFSVLGKTAQGERVELEVENISHLGAFWDARRQRPDLANNVLVQEVAGSGGVCELIGPVATFKVKDSEPAKPTWDQVCEAEPQLRELEALAEACTSNRQWKSIQRRYERLVGSHRPEPHALLSTGEAYSVVQSHLLHLTDGEDMQF